MMRISTLLPGLALAALAGPLIASEPPASRLVTGVVFEDANRNGKRDAGEKGVAGAVVSDLRGVVAAGPDGRYTLAVSPDAAIVFVSLPDGWSAVGRFWRPLEGITQDAPGDFPLARRPEGTSFTFLHASDTHLSDKSLPRLKRLRALVETKRPDFVLITGDLVKDALRVGETEARGYYEMLAAELAQFPVPVFCVPGNHDLFGIERHKSHVSPDHPLYGRGMCRRYIGPEYYSFTWGGIHFLGLDSVDYDDLWYYGHLDPAQLAWVARDLAQIPASMPVVTFNHIPLATSIDMLNGYNEEPPAPSLIKVGEKTQYRHVVSNLPDLLKALQGHRLEIALGGHMHASEAIAIDTTLGRVRFHQTAAVVGPSETAGLSLLSGVTLYRARDGRVDDGTFLPLEAE